ncbi:hypothetical protein BASA62_003239, partial [Batrachochytrium salamandrivorans]
ACLVVIDGWGIAPEDDSSGDAIRNAQTPVMTGLSAKYPSMSIDAHGYCAHPTCHHERHTAHTSVGVDAFAHAKAGTGRLHLVGLISDGGVHSHRTIAPGYLDQLMATTVDLDYGCIATIVGRYYAMDRDKRWERIQVAYEALINGTGEYTASPKERPSIAICCLPDS